MYALDKEYLPHYTYLDFEQWEGRWELIYGIPYAMSPAPVRKHQRINTKILNQLSQSLQNCSKCEAMMYIDWKIDDDIIVEPDALVICNDFDEGQYLTTAPSVVFEILSPSSVKKDRNVKYGIYEKEGVKYYIIIHPLDKTAQLFLLENGKYNLAGTFSSEKYEFETEGCRFEFDFSKIW